MVKVKFCGMTNVEDCEKAIELGADLVGFVFYRKSKRYVTPEEVRLISERIGGRILRVGVFVEETDKEIAAIMGLCGLDLCQIYRESAIEERITAYRMKDRLPEEPLPSGLILLDSFSPGFGGSGQSFDFGILEGASFLGRSFVAGGIGRHNVTDVLSCNPYGIDLVSSVETHPGKKDHREMAAFMGEVRRFGEAFPPVLPRE